MVGKDRRGLLQINMWSSSVRPSAGWSRRTVQTILRIITGLHSFPLMGAIAVPKPEISDPGAMQPLAHLSYWGAAGVGWVLGVGAPKRVVLIQTHNQWFTANPWKLERSNTKISRMAYEEFQVVPNLTGNNDLEFTLLIRNRVPCLILSVSRK